MRCEASLSSFAGRCLRQSKSMSSWAGFSQPEALPTSAIGRATPALEVLLLVVVEANSGLQPNQSRWLISVPSAQACQGCAAGSVDVCSFWLMTGRHKSNNSIDIHLVPGFNRKRLCICNRERWVWTRAQRAKRRP